MVKELSESDEEVDYKVFELASFKIRVSKEGLATFKKKKKLKEGDLMLWVQLHVRPTGIVPEGAYDKECKSFMEHIFKDKLDELRKQQKLTG